MSTKKIRALVVDDDPVLREVLANLLTGNGYLVDTASDGKEALGKIEAHIYDHLITDISMPVMDGLTLIQNVREKNMPLSITVVSAHSDMDHILRAIKMGAGDFIAKPLQSEDAILLTLRKVEERDRLQNENIRLRKEVEHKFTYANIVAKSAKMNTIFNTISKIADYKTTVLITGESGTGKELIAKAIHYNSIRKKHPLININCGGIPESLLESELFGYVKGAFTDAHRSKKGLFEEANGGTLFLDELGEMPLPLQVKLLRALQEEEIRPLGDTRSTRVDVRIIAATAKNLRQEVENKRFREDLFYRINVLAIELPPLRARMEDIPLLVDHFIKKYNKRLSLAIKKVDNDCLQCLQEYPWPGNVRELENVMERAMALADQDVLVTKHLPPELQRRSGSFTHELFGDSHSIKKNAKILEKQLIAKALQETGGNKTKAAGLLEISLPALLYKIKEYGNSLTELYDN